MGCTACIVLVLPCKIRPYLRVATGLRQVVNISGYDGGLYTSVRRLTGQDLHLLRGSRLAN